MRRGKRFARVTIILSVLSLACLIYGALWGWRALVGATRAEGQSTGTTQSPNKNDSSVPTGTGVGGQESLTQTGGQGQASVSGQPSFVSETGPIYLVSLGDSLTRGTGDDTGQGYVGLLKQSLHTWTKRTVVVNNLGINGQVSTQLLDEMSQPEVQRLLASADIVTIAIGANDLRTSTDPTHLDTGDIAKAQATFKDRLRRILEEVRRQNPSVPVFLLGLYNPFIDIPEMAAATSGAVRQWNEAEDEIAGQFAGVIVVPTFDLFERDPSRFLFVDNFHPNHKGYGRIAARIFQDLQ